MYKQGMLTPALTRGHYLPHFADRQDCADSLSADPQFVSTTATPAASTHLAVSVNKLQCSHVN